MRARIRRRATLLALGLVACRPAAGPIDVSLEAESSKPLWTPLASTIRWPTSAVAIKLPPGGPAPWLLPPFEPGTVHPLDGLEAVALGERIGLARSGRLLLVTERDEGLLGMITLPPNVVWVGVGGDDQIFAADGHGRLYAAAEVGGALAHGLAATGARLGTVSKWDAAGERVIGVVGSAVMVSEDGGRSFRSTEPARGVAIATAVVRTDGVMAALSQEGPATTYVSHDGGRRWELSEWHPEILWREDAWILGWIMGRDGDRTGPSEGETGVLSTDGRSWVGGFEADRPFALRGHREWSSDFFRGRPEPATGRWPTANDPPAPPPPEHPLRGPPHVPLDDDGFGTDDGMVGGVLHRQDVVCSNAGLACLRASVGDAPPPSRLDLWIFGDARCQGESDARRGCPSIHWRAPHLGVFDHVAGTLRLGLVPRACKQVDVTQVRGLGLLRCLRQDGRTSLMTVAPDGTVHAELEVRDMDLDLTYVTMAEDGTLLVPERHTCDPWARAWVRRPVAPGRPEAWTPLELPGVRAWRPVGRGYAVGVAEHPGREGLRADLWLAGPEREPTLVMEGIPVLDDVTDVRVDDGRVSLFTDRWMVVRRDASLAPVELPSRERVVGGVTVTRAAPSLDCP
jgi:hypothetical protein